MKKLLFIIPLITLLLVTCKKDDPDPTPAPAPAPAPAVDTTAPVIVVTGNFLDTAFVGATYTDPGATATDNKDGNITSQIVTTGTVSTTAAAHFTLNYNVSDQAGNKALTKYRFVIVKALPVTVAGNYSVACTCYTLDPGTSPPIMANSSYTAVATVSSTNANVFSLSALRIGSVTPAVNNVVINGSNAFELNTSNLNPAGLQLMSGMGIPNGGVINAAKNSMTITSHFNRIMYPNMAYTCTNVCTKF
jgi:hypothetical protein